MPSSFPPSVPSSVSALAAFLKDHRRIFVLTGAGCSTDSGIPDYRDADGSWKHQKPMTYREFVDREASRKRDWARSFVGWRRIRDATPNAAHTALARLEATGRATSLVTQNVDRLHARAGSRRTIDLHGRLDRIECLACHARFLRDDFQAELERRNGTWDHLEATTAPDGDARLHGVDTDLFDVPPCPHCGGVLKPAVVFFGERVPPRRVERAFAALEDADAMLVVGSSLMVFSGYRFAKAAAGKGVPLAVLNLGRTRADNIATLKIESPCADVLPQATALLGE